LPRRDFLRKEEEEEVTEARAKSWARAGLFGLESVEVVLLVGKPWNWEAKSSY
jgi:hypothetical protein